MRADLWPGALVGLCRSLRGLPEDTGVPGPGGHTTATQVEASLSQTKKNEDIIKKQPYFEGIQYYNWLFILVYLYFAVGKSTSKCYPIA